MLDLFEDLRLLSEKRRKRREHRLRRIETVGLGRYRSATCKCGWAVTVEDVIWDRSFKHTRYGEFGLDGYYTEVRRRAYAHLEENRIE
jgi:hypothetical protein